MNSCYWQRAHFARASCVAFLSLGTPPSFAQSDAQLRNELKAMKARIEELEKKLESMPAPPSEGTHAQWGMTTEQAQEFNKLAVKSEALEDAQESGGFKGLKISGYMDPSFIYNRRQHRAGFQFLNSVAEDGYNYDNSYFGTVNLDFRKELEGGTRWRLTLMPQRGAGAVADAQGHSIVHEASVSLPLSDLQTRLIAGQIPDWSGYEYIQATTTKLVTRGLLLDFTEPTSYTGAGMQFIRGKYDMRVLIGNLNKSMNEQGELSPVLAYRIDYAKGEFNGWGLAGVEGKAANYNNGVLAGAHSNSWLDLIEADAYFIRGDWTLQGQIGYGHQKDAAIVPDIQGHARDARWWGASGLASYKFQPRLEGVARLDYLNNSHNGGGLLGYTGYFDGAGTAGDYRNGIGATATCTAGGARCKGANRTALALGLNYLLTTNTTLKAEYRLDLATQAVFFDQASGDYKKMNSLFGASVVVGF